MKTLLLLSIAGSVFLGASALNAADAIPPGGAAIISHDAFLSPNLKLIGKDKYGESEVVPIEDMPFTKALRVTTTGVPEKEYHVQAKTFLTAPVARGETLLLTFYARSVGRGNNDTGLGQISMAIQAPGADKQPEAITKYRTNVGAEWQRFFVPIDAKASATPGAGWVSFSFGAMLQSIELAGVEVLNYGKKLTLAQLPETQITYEGREPNAAWRKEAEARIEKHRKGSLNVIVTDAAGKPMPNANVQVHMLRHHFQWGAAITSRAIIDHRVADTILQKHKELFNQGVPITFFVWDVYDKPDGKEGADATVKYMKDNGMTSRAHVLLWERSDHFPPDVQEMVKNKDAGKLRARIAAHIRDTVTKYKGRVDEWVVENEAVDNSEIRDILGEESIAEWFKIAREADPKAKLMINENRVEGLKPDKSDRLLELVKIIEDNGGKVDTIGIQGHMGSIPIPPTTLLQHYDKLAATGKTLAITEYDFESEDDQIKADFTRDFLTAVFSQPSFNCLTLWRFWDGQPHKRESVIYANDWSLRPSGQAYKDLVFNKWWTNASGKTNASGEFQTRGFYGQYEITVTAGGKKKTVAMDLLPGGTDKVDVKL